MHIALGYRWFPVAAGYHLERALRELGHTVTYVGLPAPGRPGYDSGLPIAEVLAGLPAPADLYLWVDPAGRYFPPGIEAAPVPTACYLIDVHLGHWREQAARFFDAVFIAQRDYLPAYQRAAGHPQVYWLPLAAALDVHRRLDLPKRFDVAFVGNLAAAHRGTARARRLALLARTFTTNDFFRPYLPEEVSQVYSQSRLVFNTSIAGDVTMRIFEGAACGALVLTDSIANGLGELFEAGREIVTFTDDADLLAKVRHYLDHEAERAQMAARGHQRALAEHGYTHRMRQLVETVTRPGFERLAPMRRASALERRAARRRVLTHLHMLDALFDEAYAAGRGPLGRLWEAGPALARRLR
jgi:glycosyltransferase involved in cell wall biosynthesis